MKFTRAEPTENYPKLRMVSEDGAYEVGLYPVMFGVRIRAGRSNSPVCDIDYCAGADPLFQVLLLAAVVDILESLPDGTPSSEIQNMMPRFERKPINQDPCWGKLQAMAKAAREAKS